MRPVTRTVADASSPLPCAECLGRGAWHEADLAEPIGKTLVSVVLCDACLPAVEASMLFRGKRVSAVRHGVRVREYTA
jgi:hypothetical protein